MRARYVQSPRAAFVHADMVAAVILVVCAVSVLSIVQSRTRRLANIGQDLASLRTIHGWTMSYAADFGGRVWQLSWGQGGIYWDPTDPAAAGFIPNQNNYVAARQQVTYLIRSLGGRTSAEVPNLAMGNLFPYQNYGHLALLKYLGSAAPDRTFTARGDYRWIWAGDPRGYDQGLYSPNLGIGGFNVRHPYSASFVMGTCFYDHAPRGSRIFPIATHVFGIAPNLPNGSLTGKQWASVVHPASKAFLQDTASRYTGPQPVYHMHPDARVPVLMSDGHSVVKSFRHANPGANPNHPDEPVASITYIPNAIDPQLPATNSQILPGPLWTRMGLQGRDFGGPEVYPAP